MGSRRSVATPPPIIATGPSKKEIAALEQKEKEDLKRGFQSTAQLRKRRTNINSQSRRTGFSGSGVFIPGAE